MGKVHMCIHLKISPSRPKYNVCLFIAVGFTNGALKVIDATSLEDLHFPSFRYSRDAITHVAFSHNSKYLAAAVRLISILSTHVFKLVQCLLLIQDAEFTLTLFERQKVIEGEEEAAETPAPTQSPQHGSQGPHEKMAGLKPPFKFMGRYRAHYKLIVDIMFTTQLDTDEPRLLSLSEDRHLVKTPARCLHKYVTHHVCLFLILSSALVCFHRLNMTL